MNIPPRRTNLVSRPHLVDQLNLGLERKLALISAPAGFGKTTLISTWIDQLPSGVVVSWLSLDEEDSEKTSKSEEIDESKSGGGKTSSFINSV